MKKYVVATLFAVVALLTACSQQKKVVAERPDVMEVMRQIGNSDADAFFVEMNGLGGMGVMKPDVVDKILDTPELRDSLMSGVSQQIGVELSEEDEGSVMEFARLMLTIMTKTESIAVLNVDSCKQATKTRFLKACEQLNLDAYKQLEGNSYAFMDDEAGILELLMMPNDSTMNLMCVKGKLSMKDVEGFHSESLEHFLLLSQKNGKRTGGDNAE